MVETINQARSEGIKTQEQLEKLLQEKASEIQNLLTENKEIEKLIEIKKKIMENRYVIKQYKEIHKCAKTYPEDKAFINEYNPQLMLYKKQLLRVSRTLMFYLPPNQYTKTLKTSYKKEFLIEKLNQSRQEQDRLYEFDLLWLDNSL